MGIKFANNASSTLAAGITAAATSFSVAAGGGASFPALTASDYFYATLDNNAGTIEIVEVTALSTDTFTVVRGQDGTTASAFNAGDKVEMRITAGLLSDLFIPYDSQAAVPTATTLTFAHGLGSTPSKVVVTLICTTADGTYSIGDEIDITSWMYDSGVATLQYSKDATDVIIQGSGTLDTIVGGTSYFNAKTGGAATLTVANWNIRVLAWL